MISKISRKEAAETGQHKYETGRPCRRGHLTYRYTKTGACSGCTLGYNRRYTKTMSGHLHSWMVTAHRDDVPLIKQFIETLAKARELGL